VDQRCDCDLGKSCGEKVEGGEDSAYIVLADRLHGRILG